MIRDRFRGMTSNRHRSWPATVVLTAVLVLLVPLAALPAAAVTPTWTQLSPATNPVARNAASMAYDQTAGDMVLFGGQTVRNGTSLSDYLADTWVWNGATWAEQSPTSSPSARAGAAMAYDAGNSMVVLFGGFVNNNGTGSFRNDTWEWNGTNWTSVGGRGAAPSARDDASMAYDAATGTVVLFGGIGAGGSVADTWSWNGTSWTQLSPGTSPSARNQAPMAYDSSTSDIVLFGGTGSTGPLGDTWVWDGTTWAKASPAASPSARIAPDSMDYDTATGNMVLFGGYDGTNYLADTWGWNGSTWTQQLPGTSPPARDADTTAYDPASTNIVLFGGGAATDLADTWVYQPTEATTSLTTALTAGSQSGPTISVPAGTSVNDTATLSGANASSAGGSVTYTVFSDDACSNSVANAGTVTVADGTVPNSNTVTLSASGTYYWQASYTGDTYDSPSVSACGTEVETVTALPCGGSRLQISPTSGPSGTPVTVCGDGWNPSSAIKIKFKTGKVPPGVAAYVICTATVPSDGDFSCSGTIPAGKKAGKLGPHVVKAKQLNPKVKVATTFTLT